MIGEMLEVEFSNQCCRFYFNSKFSDVEQIAGVKCRKIFITDGNVFRYHGALFVDLPVIVLQAGEQYKTQRWADIVIEKLLEMGADRETVLVGVGGGVVTDITGYVASIYMRGVRFGFVPTTLLAMTDAAIGGKNGVDVGLVKNIVGRISQPEFIIYDFMFLGTLDDREWRNGFAEIIKHAVIKDSEMFDELSKRDIDHYKNNKEDLGLLIKNNAKIKISVVKADEQERGERKLLNFGHTLGHAIEKQERLLHGEAVAIGMAFAGKLSEKLMGFKHSRELERILRKYQLPVRINYDKEKAFELMKKDKKRNGSVINYVLLKEIGQAETVEIEMDKILEIL